MRKRKLLKRGTHKGKDIDGDPETAGGGQR